ncbi:energy-coupling factor ABC transporter ATP-binding protein [Pseudohoeflea coraliihabitans]|uniref:Energy-coupling factor ABC transporter ATP-binding protein n=1 Tax=Pseudohoeflea coraliihabitans TaxID=2860393 RepID=A0ABS6WRI0_9HYPH|nr:ABC transporter ATP-binding protein [Pseudohoeflea sp. DP4N28-3]MBW3098253.1 energy-coupling factor ABC transporter ATP-binding protein [Pseudohoeflea sp. DP4N28-3]
MIVFENVSVAKGGRPVLHDINLTLGDRRIGIIGRNGSGKSTLARLFNGLEKPTRGHVRLGSAPVAPDQGAGPDPKAGDSAADALRHLRRHVGFVFQNPDNQIVYPIVREDLEFGLKNLKLPPDERRRRIKATMQRLGIAELADRFTHELSGGEKQLVALAGVLVMQPAMIVLDEPTTLLDLWNRRRLLTVLEALEQQVVLVTHDLDLLDGFDRVLLIDEGRVIADGPPHEVTDRYRSLAA